MGMEMNTPKQAGEPYDFLLRSFEDFNEATLRMQNAFRHLEKKFEDINHELETKNLELEKTLAEKEEIKNDLLNILESLTTGVVVTDLRGRISRLNRCAEVFLGTASSRALGKPLEDFLPGTVPGSPKTDMGASAGGRELKVQLKARTVEVIRSPMKAPDGAVMGSVLILRDVTRLEKLEEMAKRTERFAAMGEMAANIAHEIRNPLGSIALFASLLMKEQRNERDLERLSQIIAAVRGMDNKISNLMLFARKQVPMMRVTGLHGVLKEVIGFSGEIVRQKGVSIEAKYVKGNPRVMGDAEMLKQVFLNVILNAVQAMPGGGQLRIETSLRKNPEPAVEVCFSDTGVGIPKEHIGRIFDPFFTCREGGTGLGLAIVHNIVDTHGGSIDVDSDRRGTLVRVGLPVVRGNRARRAGPSGEEV